MSTRRPTPALRSSALPALAAVLAAGVAVEGCLPEAHAQTPPSQDAGVRPDVSRSHPRGARVPVRPPPPPTPPADPPMQVEGGISRHGTY